MYGVTVGKTQKDVLQGEAMTTENVKHAVQDYAYRKLNYQWQPPDISKFANKTFTSIFTLKLFYFISLIYLIFIHFRLDSSVSYFIFIKKSH